MAIAPLNLSVDLQTWHECGLAGLLLDMPVARFLSVSEDDEARGRAKAGPAVREAPVNSAAAFAPASEAAHPGGGSSAGQIAPGSDAAARDATDRTAAGEHGDRARRVAGTAPERAGQPPVLTAIPRSGLAPENFPEPWQRALRKVEAAPIAWTYPELGHDLLLQADQRRAEALRGIIASLKLKRGSSTFWPVRVPDYAPEPDSPDMFQAGLEHLGVKFVVVFGLEALRGTAYSSLPLSVFSEQLAGGRLILPLPDFNDILDDQAKFDGVTAFLHAVFSRFFLF